MFPDKFVVCISKLEFNPSAWTCENGALVCTKLFYNFSGLFYSGKMNVYIYIAVTICIFVNVIL